MNNIILRGFTCILKLYKKKLYMYISEAIFCCIDFSISVTQTHALPPQSQDFTFMTMQRTKLI